MLIETNVTVENVYAWRLKELERTDSLVKIPDYFNREAILTYRQALRDWPAKNDDGEYINGFPDNRPVLGE